MDRRKLRIIFCGEDGFSSVVLRSLIDVGHEVVGTIIPEYSNNAYLKLAKMCSDNGIPFIREKNINSDKVVEWTESKKPEIGVSAHFTKIIKHSLLTIPPMGFINLHPSPLPYYRGASPQHWQVANGETMSAVTVHYINEGIDTGNIILQVPLEIGPDDYVSDLQKKWLDIYPSIVVDAIKKITDGEASWPQPDIETQYYGILKTEDMILTEEMPVADIYNRIRAFSLPFTGAQYGNVKIFRAEILTDCPDNLARMPMGICSSEDGKLYLKCKDGILKLKKYVIDETSYIETPKDITNLRQEVRKREGSVVTNFNAFPAETQKWVDNKEITVLQLSKNKPGGKWLIHNNKRFSNVFFFVKGYEDIAGDLDIIESQLNVPSVIEVVSKELKSPLGMEPLMILNRMTSTSIPAISTEKPDTVQLADICDVDEINSILTKNFNPVAERIPSVRELADYIEDSGNGGIRIIKENNEIIGILIYTINSSTIHLRHFWTDANHRGKGVGSSLINEFFRTAYNCRRMILWVRTDNDNAIGVYEHYGFIPENLYDYIYQIK